MIGLKTAAGWLDLQPGTVGIEISNPLFQYDAVPGVTTYPFGVAMTPANLRALNFPHVRAAQGEQPAPEPAEFYVDGQLWRVGSLQFQEHQPDKRILTYKFAAAADDLATRIDGLTLYGLELGTAVLVNDPNQAAYALRRVKNDDFYGENKEKWPAYSGYLNDGGVLAPQPRLVWLLAHVLGLVGYSLAGDWLTRQWVQQLCVYSDRAAEDALGARLASVVLSHHLPTGTKVAELLVALQKLFAIGFDFDAVRRHVRIVPLRDVVEDDSYLVRAAGVLTRAAPSPYQGYTLGLGLEADDALAKTLDTSWATLVLDGGKTEIKTDAGTLLSVAEGGAYVPAVQRRGASPAHELGDDSRCGLRFLFDRADQLSGAVVLRWAGPSGLYEQCHRPWLDFLARAGTEERTMPFRVADLLSLNPARKELVGPRLYLWEKISVSVSTSTRLQSARFTYRNIRR